MVRLRKADLREHIHQSSKGNQLKWEKDGIWYKADYTGYEGLAEYMVSQLLRYSTLDAKEYVLYEPEQIAYADHEYLGCSSQDFREDKEWQVITAERLFRRKYNQSMYISMFRIREPEERLKFMVDQVVRMTGLSDFGQYMSKLITIDALFLNEDRHTHNIAFLWDGYDEYRYCPIFDQGASLLADTTVDYPMEKDVIDLVGTVGAKTFSRSFEEQLDIAERLYGDTIRFRYGERDIRELLERDQVYAVDVKKRVYTVLMQQRRKYQYLFK